LSKDFAVSLSANKKLYNKWKSDLTVPFTEACEETARILKSKFDKI